MVVADAKGHDMNERAGNKGLQPGDALRFGEFNDVRAALAALPRAQRATVALVYLEDLSVAEVATALNVPAGTVKTRLMHARRKLRAALEGDL